MSQFENHYRSLKFTDDYVFCHVLMENPDLCKKIAELATGRKIKEIKSLETQKSIQESPDGKGVRFDVVFEDEESTVYDIEMQQADQHNLPKRTRYYQSLSDLEALRSGDSYRSIRKSYIIFICNFDPFKYGAHKYLAKTKLDGFEDANYDDGVEKIFLNTHYKEPVDDLEMREFLDYVRLGIINGGLTTDLETAVSEILNSDERRTEYMCLYEKLQAMKEEGVTEGIAKGITEGEKRKEQEIVLSAIREGLPKETVLRVFNISDEKYSQYVSML